MKKAIILGVIAIAVVLTLVFALGRGDAGAKAGADDAAATPIEAPELGGLAQFDGWWYRPDDYPTGGIALFEYFRVDAKNATWTGYNSYGEAVETGECHEDHGGKTLVLSLGPPFGSAVFGYDGKALLGRRRVEFVRGEPHKPFDKSIFAGKWFMNGDKDGDYFLLDETTYKIFDAGSAVDPVESGTWILKDMYVVRSGQDTVKEMTIDLETEAPSYRFGGQLTVTDDKVALYNGNGRRFFVKESEIGKPAGDQAVKMFQDMQQPE